MVDAPVNPNQVKVYGPGIDSNKVRENIPVTFKVDTSKAGKAPLGVQIRSDRGKFKLFIFIWYKFLYECFLKEKPYFISKVDFCISIQDNIWLFGMSYKILVSLKN